MSVRILLGDMMVRLRDLPDASVDSVVTDPPYHLTSIVKRFGAENAAPAKSNGATGAYARASKGFMGQTWDGGDVAFRPETWAEVLRVLKPGAHLVAFSGTRTYHRMVCAIEDAGFEIRDQLAWIYGSGFPKSHDVSKAIDKMAGAEREVVSAGKPVKRMIPGADQNKKGWKKDNGREFVPTVTAAATPEAEQWAGWGTALKPSWEPIVLARKPLIGSVAANVLQHGTGAINIDGSRIKYASEEDAAAAAAAERRSCQSAERNFDGWGMRQQSLSADEYMEGSAGLGRWPANLCHDGSEEVLANFPDEAGAAAPVRKRNGDKFRSTYGALKGNVDERGGTFQGDSGSAARFFYCAKATTEERGEGNHHPTVKPVALMRWLCRLVTPKGGTILDPFTGSGSTALACDAEQFNFIGCELSADYAAIAERRVREAAGMFADVTIEHAGPATRSAA